MNTPTTSRGTPCSPAWDDSWVAVVEAAEQSLGHRICGARTLAGNPCPLPQNHANGRCKFHGGFNLTGAQPGNRNAVIHGLYSRALRPCDASCPLWAKCPCADDAVKALPAPDRPTCPYEAALYNAAFTDTLARAPRDSDGEPFPHYVHLCHQMALLETMMERAATVLREHPLVDTVSAAGDKYTMESTKPSAYLQAFLRISSEYRAYCKLLDAQPLNQLGNAQLIEHERRTQHDTDLQPEHQASVEQTPSPTEIRAVRLLKEAHRNLNGHRTSAACDYFDAALSLAPHVAEPKRAELEAAIEARVQSPPEPNGNSQCGSDHDKVDARPFGYRGPIATVFADLLAKHEP